MGKLRIGSKICCSLLGKVLADLANMREESLATVVRPLCQPTPGACLAARCSICAVGSNLLPKARLISACIDRSYACCCAGAAQRLPGM